MEPLRFEEYEELLRKAGVRRSPDGTLVFDQAVADDAAATALELREDDDAESAPRRAADAPQPLASSVSGGKSSGAALRGGSAAEDRDDDLGAAFAWEADLELIAGEVDHHANALKGAVLGRLLALKAKLTEQVSLLDSERRFINARAAALQNKADQLQEALFRERALSGRTRLRVLSVFLRLRPGPDLKEAFQRWRAYLLEKKRRRAALQAADAHANAALRRATLRSWRTVAHACFRERMHAALDTRWAEAAHSEAQKFGTIVARLESELADARAALERETGARQEAEERFKQAFMRGVCALNFEALAVLKNSSGPLVDALKGQRGPPAGTQ